MSSDKKYLNNCVVGYLSDIGNVRKVNEDYIGYWHDKNFRLYIVADGMGGHNAGDVASELAVKSCIKYMKNIKYTEDLDAEKELKNAIEHSNYVLYKMSKTKEELQGMGTTITVCLIYKDKAIIANVGDSSCYAIYNNKIEKITKDHSLVQELVDDGTITEKEALTHPNKNIITRALGTKENVDIDIFTLNLRYISKFILCTDGLTNGVSKEEMYDIILKNNNMDSCKKLIDLCKSNGGKDNISVIVFEGECKDDRDYSR